MLLLVLIFPVWWLIIGYFLRCSSKSLSIASILLFIGGMVGFFIAFACNGGAGGSSQLSASAWDCLLPYLVVYHISLASIIYLGRRKNVG
jgi:hypothetical protein